MQDNKMKKDIQIPVNPLGRLLLGICSRGTRDEGEKKTQFYPFRVSTIKLPTRVKKNVKTISMQRA